MQNLQRNELLGLFVFLQQLVPVLGARVVVRVVVAITVEVKTGIDVEIDPATLAPASDVTPAVDDFLPGRLSTTACRLSAARFLAGSAGAGY